MNEIGNGGIGEKAKNHLVLTSPEFGKSCQGKTFVICEDLSFGKEAMLVPCVIVEDLMNPSLYALLKEGIHLKHVNGLESLVLKLCFRISCKKLKMLFKMDLRLLEMG